MRKTRKHFSSSSSVGRLHRSMLSSPASLFYLRHTRSCAASPFGARSTSGVPRAGDRLEEGICIFDELLTCVLTIMRRSCEVLWRCAASVFQFITPLELLACKCLVEYVCTLSGISSCLVALARPPLQVTLAVAVMHAVCKEAHMPDDASCRWMSFVVAEILQ